MSSASRSSAIAIRAFGSPRTVAIGIWPRGTEDRAVGQAVAMCRETPDDAASGSWAGTRAGAACAPLKAQVLQWDLYRIVVRQANWWDVAG